MSRAVNSHPRLAIPLLGALFGGLLIIVAMVQPGDWIGSFLDSRALTLYPAASGVSGVLLGFTIAAVSVLADRLTTPRFTQSLSSDDRIELVDAYVDAAYWDGLATTAAIGGIFLTDDCAQYIGFLVWLVIASASVAATLRTLGLLRHALRGAVS